MTASLGSNAPLGSKAVAILEALKALPSEEQNVFVRLFRSWETTGGSSSTGKDGEEALPVQWPDFAGRMQKLFPDGPIPGDPQEFWDQEREDRV